MIGDPRDVDLYIHYDNLNAVRLCEYPDALFDFADINVYSLAVRDINVYRKWLQNRVLSKKLNSTRRVKQKILEEIISKSTIAKSTFMSFNVVKIDRKQNRRSHLVVKAKQRSRK